MPRPHAPFFASPPRFERMPEVTFGGDTVTGWAAAAARARCHPHHLQSPFLACQVIVEKSGQLTKSSERLTRSAGMVLATGGALSWLMDVEDAKATLKFVAAKERTRAAKRKAAADAAAAVETAQKQRVGAARAAKRAEVAARPPKTRLRVDTLGRFQRS